MEVCSELIFCHLHSRNLDTINDLSSKTDRLSQEVTRKDKEVAQTSSLLSVLEAISEIQSGHINLAEASLMTAWNQDPVSTLEYIDQYTDSAAGSDSTAIQLRKIRHALLAKADGLLSTSEALRDYVCAHNTFVVGISERPNEVEHRLALTRRDFPNAELGRPSNGFVPIIIDSFLTCKQAAERVIQADNRWKKGAFVNDWYTGLGCISCPGLNRGHASHE